MNNHKKISISFYLGFDKFDPANDQETLASFRTTLLKNPSGIYEFPHHGQEKPAAEQAREALASLLKGSGIQGQVFWKLSDEAEIQENSQLTLTNTYERQKYSQEKPYEEHITFPYYLDLEKIDTKNISLARILRTRPSGEFRFETKIRATVNDLAWDTEATQAFEQGTGELKTALKKAGARGSVWVVGVADWSKIATGTMIASTARVALGPNIQNPFALN